MTTVHASAVLTGASAVLIRGPSGSGKSRLALELIEAMHRNSLLFARLVADDRVQLDAAGGRLLARAPLELAGLIEVRGCGLLRVPYEPSAVVGFVVDLAAGDAARMPEPNGRAAEIGGVVLPRLAVAAGESALPGVLAFINSPRSNWI